MKLYCGISFHGFGHLAQSAPIINRLHAHHQLNELIIQCDAPRALLEKWFTPAFTHIQKPTDLGIPMLNAIKVNAEETYRQYLDQHNHKTEHIQNTSDLIAHHQPDLVLSNNSYLLSRAAAGLNIPCFHFCSLNWADNFYAYCKDKPYADEIYQALCDDYNQAEAFFRLPPAMPMPGFTNLIDVGPVCRTGTKINLKQHFQHADDKLYVLVSMGGMPYPIDLQSWPTNQNIFYINGGAPTQTKPNLINLEDTNLSHLDLVTSCDVIVTKPGYGTYMEAACSGTPILYLPRGDWPEEPYLNEWQQPYCYCQSISDAQLQSGDLLIDIKKAAASARSAPARMKASPIGIEKIVQHIVTRLN
jgi:hypothetical protein